MILQWHFSLPLGFYYNRSAGYSTTYVYCACAHTQPIPIPAHAHTSPCPYQPMPIPVHAHTSPCPYQPIPVHAHTSPYPYQPVPIPSGYIHTELGPGVTKLLVTSSNRCPLPHNYVLMRASMTQVCILCSAKLPKNVPLSLARMYFLHRGRKVTNTHQFSPLCEVTTGN